MLDQYLQRFSCAELKILHAHYWRFDLREKFIFSSSDINRVLNNENSTEKFQVN